MKKTIALLIAIILSLSLFAGCKQEVKVTEENVAELFKPSLEAYIYYQGSAFYEIEKDEDQKPISYESPNGNYIECFKILENKTIEEIKDKLYSYVFETQLGFDEYWFTEINNELYIGMGGYDTGIINFDLNSINLYKTDGDKYYISVDAYSIYPTNDEKHKEGDVVYINSYVFITTIKNNILYIEGLDDEIKRENINPENERFYINDTDKFYGNILNEKNNLTEKN